VAVGRRVGCRHRRQQRRRRAGQPKLRLLQLQLGADLLNLFFFVTVTSKNVLWLVFRASLIFVGNSRRPHNIMTRVGYGMKS
jgi:hypothetical protein